ncbi:hypothetical protein RND71_026053 [Anisodus tanguticus]|uniref:DUF7804 domain-containing protein n=1 Tax=Anisodus tanguticus TaxID=243964 RepID=A0AAE1VA36_9SOLA|nr:hypothetical protein RND71_026053 [Anisodus tanguticus]
MKVSMVDIVKNLKQAPLFVHIYANENDRGQERRPEIKTERALVEKWSILKSDWESGKTRTPDGLILVDELEELNENSEEVLTKSWGVVVQGKGIEFGPACYLLKTSRVRAGRGMGLFCTHFCLNDDSARAILVLNLFYEAQEVVHALGGFKALLSVSD